MEGNVLKDFATFSEFPDSYLEINNNSNYYFINKPLGAFVTKRRVDLVSTISIYNKEKYLEKESYYDVITGELILKTESLCNLDGSNKEFVKKPKGVKVISLSSILEKDEEFCYLSKDDVNKLIKSNRGKSKTHTLTYKK